MFQQCGEGAAGCWASQPRALLCPDLAWAGSAGCWVAASGAVLCHEQQGANQPWTAVAGAYWMLGLTSACCSSYLRKCLRDRGEEEEEDRSRRPPAPLRSCAWRRPFSLLSIAGLLGFCQVSILLGIQGGVLISVSLLGRHGADCFLVVVAQELHEALRDEAAAGWGSSALPNSGVSC